MYNSGLQIMSLISDHLRFMTSVDIGDFSCWDIKKSQFQFLVTFLAVFFMAFKLYKSGLYIITYFDHRQCFIWGLLVFSFLVSSVFKYLKSTFSRSFSRSGQVTVLVFKLYMPGLWIILLFWICPKFWTTFISDCF